MKDHQDNTLQVGDIVFTCVEGRSKRLREGVVFTLGKTGKKAEIASFEDNPRKMNWGVWLNNKTSATIIKAVNQDKDRIPKYLMEEMKQEVA
jgi:hypothetical protein